MLCSFVGLVKSHCTEGGGGGGEERWLHWAAALSSAHSQTSEFFLFVAAQPSWELFITGQARGGGTFLNRFSDLPISFDTRHRPPSDGVQNSQKSKFDF